MAYLKANYPVEFQEVMKDDIGRYWD